MPPFHLRGALALHLLIELPASLSFLLQPRAQLPGASPDAVLILRNLGGLLMATNLACLVLLFASSGAYTVPLLDEAGATTAEADMSSAAFSRSVEKLMAMICLALGTYHVWPIHRAWVKMRLTKRKGRKRNGEGVGQGEARMLGGPVVHFWVHLLCLGVMFGSGGAALARI